MSDVTVRQLAEVVGIPLDRLLVQLGEAAGSFATRHILSDSEKLKLLAHLRQSMARRRAKWSNPPA